MTTTMNEVEVFEFVNKDGKALTVSAEQFDIMFNYNNKQDAINHGVDVSDMPDWEWNN